MAAKGLKPVLFVSQEFKEIMLSRVLMSIETRHLIGQFFTESSIAFRNYPII